MDVLDEIARFSTTLVSKYSAVDENVIIDFEHRYGISLPNDYRSFLKETNGIDLMGTTVFGITNVAYRSLENSYNIEHFEVQNPMPLSLLPFSPNGGGNHYCFDLNTRNEQSCKIVFWQHDFEYDDYDLPEVVNESFLHWMKNWVIANILEDYNYNGDEKE